MFTVITVNLAFWVAMYAAVVSTFNLGWDVYKWIKAGVAIELQALPNMTITNEREPFWHGTGAVMSVQVTNLGGKTTTITHVSFLSYSGRWNALINRCFLRFLHKRIRNWLWVAGWVNKPIHLIFPPDGQNLVLPTILEPGNIFNAVVPHRALNEMAGRRNFLVINHSMGKGNVRSAPLTWSAVEPVKMPYGDA